MTKDAVRHVKKRVLVKDIKVGPRVDLCLSIPPHQKKKITNIYYDPATEEVVIEVEDT